MRRESLFTERCFISTLGSADLARKGTAGEIAEAEHVTRSVVTRLLRLLPSRRVVEAILECRQPKSDAVAGADAAMPSGWEEQRDRFAYWDDLQSLG